MAKKNEKFEHLASLEQKKLAKKYALRDKKTSKPKMTVTGKSVFGLQKLIVTKKK